MTYKYKDILILWLEQKKDIKIQSQLRYEEIINKYIIDLLGNLYLQDINKKIIIEAINDYKTRNLSLSVIRTIIYIIKSSLKYAYEEHYMDYINLNDLKIKNDLKTIYIFSKEEQNILVNYLQNNINIRKVCLLLCIYTGLRIGEICGLKWEDIDFNHNSLIVKRTIERIKNKNNNNNNNKSKTILIASTPKSDTSNRVIPIPMFLIGYLKSFQGDRDNYLLSQSHKLYDPRYFEEFYKGVIRKCDIQYINFHTLRHTFATRAIEAQMDIKTLSEILGHSSIEITLKLYVHPSFELKKQAIENLVEFMAN